MNKNTHSTYVSRVKSRLKELGLNASQTSIKINGKAGLLSDSFRKGTVLNSDNMVRLAQILETTPEFLIGKTNIKERPDKLEVNLNSAKIIGHVQAGLWETEEEPLPEEELDILPIPTNFPYKKVYGLIVKGESMNLDYNEGDQLLCIDIWEYGQENIKPGDHIVVKATNQADEVETTVKELEVDEYGHLWLIPRSTKDTYKKYPVPSKGGNVDFKINGLSIKHIEIKAYVYSSTRVRKGRLP